MMNLKELVRILRDSGTTNEIDKRRDDIADLIPAVSIMFGYDQQNLAHQYDLWEHSLQTVVGLPKDIDDDMVFLAALIHDIGKPDCQIYDERDGQINMHYYGHPVRSMEIARDQIIPDLLSKGEELSEADQRRLIYYVEYHDDRMSLRMKHLRQHMNLGASLQEFQNLMKLQVSDAKAHVLIPIVQQRIEICSQLAGEYAEKLYQDILAGK
ncbi:MAG: HD domain-containing protein [Lachnospiraceae bacterium]|nr:HD domain-containing protein [Lachnospiraceae bacterium]